MILKKMEIREFLSFKYIYKKYFIVFKKYMLLGDIKKMWFPPNNLKYSSIFFDISVFFLSIMA